jgi:hypothetical protein
MAQGEGAEQQAYLMRLFAEAGLLSNQPAAQPGKRHVTHLKQQQQQQPAPPARAAARALLRRAGLAAQDSPQQVQLALLVHTRNMS